MKRFSVLALGTLMTAGLVVTGMAGVAVAKKAPTTVVTSVSPNDGPMSGGTIVTIKGKNLLGSTVVDFGTTPATTVTPKGNEIIATSPAETGGTVDILVSGGPDGPSSPVTADEFTYTGGPTLQSVNPRIGADTGGTKITISGSDFSSPCSVSFGGTTAPCTVDSTQEVSTVSPAESPGKVDVTVTTPDGTTPVNTNDSYTFAVRVPIVQSIEPQSGTAGTSVTITGSRFVKKGTTVTFGGVTATATVVSSSQIDATAPAGTGTVDIIVTTSKGTSSATPADQFTYVSSAS
jgi:IPT/TIG domain-containing protein